MLLGEKQLRYLRGLAHTRKAVVLVGAAGLTDAVTAEIRAALHRHELLKVKVSADTRGERDAIIADICERTGAQLIQRVGHVATLFLQHPERSRINLPSG